MKRTQWDPVVIHNIFVSTFLFRLLIGSNGHLLWLFMSMILLKSVLTSGWIAELILGFSVLLSYQFVPLYRFPNMPQWMGINLRMI